MTMMIQAQANNYDIAATIYRQLPRPPNTCEEYDPPDNPHPQLRDPTGIRHPRVYDNLRRAYKKAGNKWIVDHPRSIYSDLIRYGLRFYKSEDESEYNKRNYTRFDQVIKAIKFLHETGYPYDIDCERDEVRCHSPNIYNTEGRFHDVFLFMAFFYQCGNAYKSAFFKWFVRAHRLNAIYEHHHDYYDYLLSVLFLSGVFLDNDIPILQLPPIATNDSDIPCLGLTYNTLSYAFDLLCDRDNDAVDNDAVDERPFRGLDEYVYTYLFEIFRHDLIIKQNSTRSQLFEKCLCILFDAKVPITKQQLATISNTFVANPYVCNDDDDDYAYYDPDVSEQISNDTARLSGDIDEPNDNDMNIILRYDVPDFDKRLCINNTEEEFLDHCRYYYNRNDGRIPFEFIRRVCTFRISLYYSQTMRYICRGMQMRNLYQWKAWQAYDRNVAICSNIKLQFIMRNLAYLESVRQVRDCDELVELIMEYC